MVELGKTAKNSHVCREEKVDLLAKNTARKAKMQLDKRQLLFEDKYLVDLGFWETPTYPSPKPTFCPKREVSANVGLGEG